MQNPNLPEILTRSLGKDTDIEELKKEINSIDKIIAKLKSDEDKYYAYLVDEEKLKILKEEKILGNIGKINEEMDQLKKKRDTIFAEVENAKDNCLNIGKITELLKSFDTVFDDASFEHQKKLLHSTIKEIKIKPSKDIDERLDEAIILRINDIDLLEYTSGKPYEVTYDTVPPS